MASYLAHRIVETGVGNVAEYVCDKNTYRIVVQESDAKKNIKCLVQGLIDIQSIVLTEYVVRCAANDGNKADGGIGSENTQLSISCCANMQNLECEDYNNMDIGDEQIMPKDCECWREKIPQPCSGTENDWKEVARGCISVKFI